MIFAMGGKSGKGYVLVDYDRVRLMDAIEARGWTLGQAATALSEYLKQHGGGKGRSYHAIWRVLNRRTSSTPVLPEMYRFFRIPERLINTPDPDLQVIQDVYYRIAKLAPTRIPDLVTDVLVSRDRIASDTHRLLAEVESVKRPLEPARVSASSPARERPPR